LSVNAAKYLRDFALVSENIRSELIGIEQWLKVITGGAEKFADTVVDLVNLHHAFCLGLVHEFFLGDGHTLACRSDLQDVALGSLHFQLG